MRQYITLAALTSICLYGAHPAHNMQNREAFTKLHNTTRILQDTSAALSEKKGNAPTDEQAKNIKRALQLWDHYVQEQEPKRYEIIKRIYEKPVSKDTLQKLDTLYRNTQAYLAATMPYAGQPVLTNVAFDNTEKDPYYKEKYALYKLATFMYETQLLRTFAEKELDLSQGIFTKMDEDFKDFLRTLKKDAQEKINALSSQLEDDLLRDNTEATQADTTETTDNTQTEDKHEQNSQYSDSITAELRRWIAEKNKQENTAATTDFNQELQQKAQAFQTQHNEKQPQETEKASEELQQTETHKNTGYKNANTSEAVALPLPKNAPNATLDSILAKARHIQIEQYGKEVNEIKHRLAAVAAALGTPDFNNIDLSQKSIEEIPVAWHGLWYNY